MAQFVPTNFDLRTTLIFCYHLKKLLQNRIACLSKLTVIKLLVSHSAMRVLKKIKVAILTWETKNVEDHRKSLQIARFVGWGWRSNATTRGSIKCDTRSSFHTFKSHGQDSEGGKMGSTCIDWTTAGKPKNHLRNSARQVQKEIISPSNCDWWRKVDLPISTILSVKDHG